MRPMVLMRTAFKNGITTSNVAYIINMLVKGLARGDLVLHRLRALPWAWTGYHDAWIRKKKTINKERKAKRIGSYNG